MRKLKASVVLADVAQRIVELRIDRELTQERLAEKLGVSRQYMSRIETGRENLSLRSLVKIANILDADLTDLVRAPKLRETRGPGRPKRGAQ